MIECFWCSSPNSEERREIARHTFEVWQGLEVDLIPLTPEFLNVNHFSFQKARRQYAEANALGKFYILVDDDCLPSENNDTIQFILEDLETHPQFGIISAWPIESTMGRWTPEGYEIFEDAHVIEHHDVGGLRFVRKGCMKDWPEQTRLGYDYEHCEALRAEKWLVGHSKHGKYLHFGEGQSDLWNQRLPSEIAQLTLDGVVDYLGTMLHPPKIGKR